MDATTIDISDIEHSRYDELLSRVGHLTRSLHESLRELGLDKEIERLAKDDITNTRDRLMYVAKMTEQAAQRVLNATDAASPLQEAMERGATGLAEEWQAALASPAGIDAGLGQRTLDFLQTTRDAASDTKKHLMDIMLAQDFQDLTGQVITKVTKLGHSLESQLVQLLIDHAPVDGRRDAGNGLLNGPQVNPEGKTKSRSLMHGLALSFRCAVRDLIDSVRDSLRSATRTTPAKAPPASAAAVAPKGPNADCATSVKTLSGVLANDVKTMGLQCTAIPKLLHDIFAGRDFTQIRGDDLTKSMPANSHQESRLVLRVLAFMQNPPATDVDGKADLGRDETIVRITQQLATLLPDDVKARCAPLLDGLGTANFSERGPKLAALLQAPVGQ